MVDHKDLPIPEIANKLKYLMHKHQLPVGGLLYNGYMQMCKESSAHDSIKKPLIVDLPWVADAFAEEDKGPGTSLMKCWTLWRDILSTTRKQQQVCIPSHAMQCTR